MENCGIGMVTSCGSRQVLTVVPVYREAIQPVRNMKDTPSPRHPVTGYSYSKRSERWKVEGVEVWHLADLEGS